MAIAGRTYPKFDAAFAQRALAAAGSAWTWLGKNPNVLYRNPWGVSTGAKPYDDYFLANYPKHRETVRPAGPPSWASVGALALWTYALSPRANRQAAATLRDDSLQTAQEIAGRTARHPYRIRMIARNFVWGSNGVAANYGVQLLVANAIKPDPRFRAAALDNLHYLLGRNFFSLSGVTQVGANPFRRPHHRPSGADSNPEPWPGLLAGGPNGRQQDPAMRKLPDLPPARMYVDDQESYASNENCINWNAPLVFLLAGASSEGGE